jgi:FAD binding domain
MQIFAGRKRSERRWATSLSSLTAVRNRPMSTKSLRIAIVGGGIGGVTAANALLQHGIEVHLYEQATALTEVGAGVAIQPNGVRMLRHLGLGDGLVRYGATRWVDHSFDARTVPTPLLCGRCRRRGRRNSFDTSAVRRCSNRAIPAVTAPTPLNCVDRPANIKKGLEAALTETPV